MSPTLARTLVVCCADWPLVAAGCHEVPAVVVHGNVVRATSAPARLDGVEVGQRRREAQRRCPDLVLVEQDPARDARALDAVVAALEALTPRLEVTGAGTVSFSTRGPARYFGGEAALAQRARRLVLGVAAAGVEVGVGVADGAFAAGLAAGSDAAAGLADGVVVVPMGSTASFLAPLPLSVLDRPVLAGVLGRLGLHDLGALARLPPAEVLARFGADGLAAWRLAAARAAPPLAPAPPAVALTVATQIDPPLESVEAVAFVARGLADELHRGLLERGSWCPAILVGAESDHGERSERVWRHDGPLGVAAMVDRVRWQLEGWLAGSSRQRPTAGLSRLWLEPVEVVPAGGRQLGFWGSDTATTERAARAVDRLQGLLGAGAVAVPEWRGGRDPAERVALVGAEAVELDPTRPAARSDWVVEPWPGRLPAPSPALVFEPPRPTEVVDSEGRPVGVSGRGMVSSPPARVRVGPGPWRSVVAWAGPWPIEERWWDRARARRRARFQLLDDAGAAHLSVLEGGRWVTAATYD